MAHPRQEGCFFRSLACSAISFDFCRPAADCLYQRDDYEDQEYVEADEIHSYRIGEERFRSNRLAGGEHSVGIGLTSFAEADYPASAHLQAFMSS